MKILVIDDEIDLLDLYKELLEDEGYEIETSLSGEDAIERLDKESFSLIICDKNMGEKSGLDVLKFVEEKTGETPFFLVTGEPQRELSFQNEKSQVIPKPLDFAVLYESVKKVEA